MFSRASHLVLTLAAASIVSHLVLQVSCEPQVRPDEVRGMLEGVAVRAQQSLQSLWQRARSQAEGMVRGVVGTFRRQEHDALHAATVQFEQLGLDLDLNEAGDQVNDDLFGCAQATQEKYARLLQKLRRRVERCWGWESREVRDLVRAMGDLVYVGDRLPALIQTNLDLCLHPKKKVTKPKAKETRQLPDPGPSPLRLIRCTAESVNLTWTYVTAVPREVGRVARRSAGLLGSSREDWMSCSRQVVRQSAGPALQVLKELGSCVADKVSEQSWLQLHRAWYNARR